MNEHLPIRDISVRGNDVPYMTEEWKNAIKAKRRLSKKYSKSPTQENFERKRKWRIEETKQRRVAIKAYWKKVSDGIKSYPGRGSTKSLHMELEVDQTKVAEHLAHYFSRMADGIGGDNVQSLMAVDFNHHRSVRYISTNLPNATSEQFEFTPLSTKQVQETLEKLNPSKATRLTQEHLKSEAENYSTISYWDL